METKIIDLTEKAIHQIRQIFQAEDRVAGSGLRLGVVGGGCSGLSYKIDFDEQKDGDHILEFEGFRVLIDLKSSIYLKGVVLDYEDGLQGKGFTFKNPNASNTCGCGESFSV